MGKYVFIALVFCLQSLSSMELKQSLLKKYRPVYLPATLFLDPKDQQFDSFQKKLEIFDRSMYPTEMQLNARHRFDASYGTEVSQKVLLERKHVPALRFQGVSLFNQYKKDILDTTAYNNARFCLMEGAKQGDPVCQYFFGRILEIEHNPLAWKYIEEAAKPRSVTDCYMNKQKEYHLVYSPAKQWLAKQALDSTSHTLATFSASSVIAPYTLVPKQNTNIQTLQPEVLAHQNVVISSIEDTKNTVPSVKPNLPPRDNDALQNMSLRQAKKGRSHAMYLQVSFALPRNGKHDVAQALNWTRQLIKTQDRKYIGKALNLWENLSAKKHTFDSCLFLSTIYKEGTNGILPSLKKALQYACNMVQKDDFEKNVKEKPACLKCFQDLVAKVTPAFLKKHVEIQNHIESSCAVLAKNAQKNAYAAQAYAMILQHGICDTIKQQKKEAMNYYNRAGCLGLLESWLYVAQNFIEKNNHYKAITCFGKIVNSKNHLPQETDTYLKNVALDCLRRYVCEDTEEKFLALKAYKYLIGHAYAENNDELALTYLYGVTAMPFSKDHFQKYVAPIFNNAILTRLKASVVEHNALASLVYAQYINATLCNKTALEKGNQIDRQLQEAYELIEDTLKHYPVCSDADLEKEMLCFEFGKICKSLGAILLKHNNKAGQIDVENVKNGLQLIYAAHQCGNKDATMASADYLLFGLPASLAFGYFILPSNVSGYQLCEKARDLGSERHAQILKELRKPNVDCAKPSDDNPMAQYEYGLFLFDNMRYDEALPYLENASHDKLFQASLYRALIMLKKIQTVTQESLEDYKQEACTLLDSVLHYAGACSLEEKQHQVPYDYKLSSVEKRQIIAWSLRGLMFLASGCNHIDATIAALKRLNALPSHSKSREWQNVMHELRLLFDRQLKQLNSSEKAFEMLAKMEQLNLIVSNENYLLNMGQLIAQAVLQGSKKHSLQQALVYYKAAAKKYNSGTAKKMVMQIASMLQARAQEENEMKKLPGRLEYEQSFTKSIQMETCLNLLRTSASKGYAPAFIELVRVALACKTPNYIVAVGCLQKALASWSAGTLHEGHAHETLRLLGELYYTLEQQVKSTNDDSIARRSYTSLQKFLSTESITCSYVKDTEELFLLITKSDGQAFKVSLSKKVF